MSEDYAYHEDTINNKFTFKLDNKTLSSFKAFENYTLNELDILFAYINRLGPSYSEVYLHKQLYYIKNVGFINPVIPFDLDKMVVVEAYGITNIQELSDTPHNFDLINNFSLSKLSDKACMTFNSFGYFSTYNDTFSYYNNIYLPRLLLAHTNIKICGVSSFTYDGLLIDGRGAYSGYTTQHINDNLAFVISGGLLATLENGWPKEIHYTHPLDDEWSNILIKSA